MPRIPDATDLGPRVLPTAEAPRFEDRSGEIRANAIAQAAASISESTRQFAAKRASQDAAEGISTLRAKWAQRYIELENSAAEDGSGFMDALGKEFDGDLA